MGNGGDFTILDKNGMETTEIETKESKETENENFGNIKYHIVGKVLPERAQMSIGFNFLFKDPTTGSIGLMKTRVIANHITAIADVSVPWDIFFLRDILSNALKQRLATIGFLNGFSYEFDVSSICCEELEVNYVFGIDNPVVSELTAPMGFGETFSTYLKKMEIIMNSGFGNSFSRILYFFNMGIRSPEETAFYMGTALDILLKLSEKTGCEIELEQDVKESILSGLDFDPLNSTFGFSYEKKKVIIEGVWKAIKNFIDVCENSMEE